MSDDWAFRPPQTHGDGLYHGSRNAGGGNVNRTDAESTGSPPPLIDSRADDISLAAPKITISVYLDDGRVYDYQVSTVASAREHMAAIVATGYRSVQADDPTTLTHYPPHRIVKVKATGVQFQTMYFDSARGT
jgi:hypothetical protein